MLSLLFCCKSEKSETVRKSIHEEMEFVDSTGVAAGQIHIPRVRFEQ